MLAIGMSEPAGASGVEADLRAIAEAGGRGIAVVTAMVVEAGAASRVIAPLAARDLRALIRGARRRGPAAVKLGMLPSDQLVQAAAAELRQEPSAPVVLDPVFAAPGFRAPEPLIHACSTHLLPLATVVTADVHEARDLVGEALDRHSLVRALVEMGVGWVVLKGDPDAGGQVEDLVSDGRRWFAIRSAHAATGVEGADAAFASALAARLAAGQEVEKAAGNARQALLERARQGRAGGATGGPG